jgi:hypothetical protein
MVLHLNSNATNPMVRVIKTTVSFSSQQVQNWIMSTDHESKIAEDGLRYKRKESGSPFPNIGSHHQLLQMRVCAHQVGGLDLQQRIPIHRLDCRC